MNLKETGRKMGRQMIADRALAIARQIVECGTAKNAVAGIGRMTALGKACDADPYWREKRELGQMHEINAIECFDMIGKFPDQIKELK